MTKNKVVRVAGWGIFCLIFLWQGCRNGASNAQKQLQKAEELYALGTSSNQHSNYEESTTYLKQAEEILESIQPSAVSHQQLAQRDQLLGLTRFHLGNTSESEMLYEIAGSYYRKAIPLLEQGENAVYLACAYRDIARTMALTGGEQDSVLWYFAQAKQYAQTAQSDVLLLDIDAYRYQLCYPDSVTQRLAVCKELAEKHGAHARYSEIVELLLAQHATDSAAFYLERLQPKDSSYAYWFEQSYAYLQSKVLRQRGKSDKAYEVLLDLYDRKIEELQRDAGARTYALSLHYDVAREQQLAQEAQRERQWQRKISLVLVLLLVLVVAVSAIVIYRIINNRIQLEHTKTMTIRDADIYQHLLSTTKVMSETEQHEAWELINKVYPDFLPTLQKLGVEKEQDMKVCLLLKMGFKPSRIAALVSRSDSAIANTRARLYIKVFGKDGKAEDWDKFIISL